MATLKDAEQAREQAAEQLRGLGAHAISVEEVPPDEAAAAPDATGAARRLSRDEPRRRRADRRDGGGPAPEGTEPTEGADATEDGSLGGGPRRRRRRRTFAVVAWFADEPPADLPQALEIRAGTRKKTVPLRTRRVERFRAE